MEIVQFRHFDLVLNFGSMARQSTISWLLTTVWWTQSWAVWFLSRLDWILSAIIVLREREGLCRPGQLTHCRKFRGCDSLSSSLACGNVASRWVLTLSTWKTVILCLCLPHFEVSLHRTCVPGSCQFDFPVGTLFLSGAWRAVSTDGSACRSSRCCFCLVNFANIKVAAISCSWCWCLQIRKRALSG